MVRYRRHFICRGTYFFTVVLADRRAATLTAKIALSRAAFRRAREERPFTLNAMVVLPDHLYAVMTLPDGDHDFPLRWRRIKTIFTQGSPDTAGTQRRDGSGRTVWQRRFWEHTIRDETDFSRHVDYIHITDFSRHVDYIHINPVKHGHVQNPTA